LIAASTPLAATGMGSAQDQPTRAAAKMPPVIAESAT
jgi:hypothetical protein